MNIFINFKCRFINDINLINVKKNATVYFGIQNSTVHSYVIVF